MKKLVYFLLIASGFAFASCDDWLDVKPKTEVDSDVLFRSESGFKSALSGVYTMMTDQTLYGKEMTFGLVGVLGMEWSVTTSQIALSTNEYYYAKDYDYTNAVVKSKIASVWSKQYNAIANVNKLLDYTESRKDVLSSINYHVIRGEAFALRAFLHFDLLRLFGTTDFNSDKGVIPYVKTSLPLVTTLSTNAVVAANVLSDLNQAEELLKTDPIKTGEDYSSIDDGYLNNRKYHLNYWAVKALKARVYLYENKKDSALLEASQVINAQTGTLFRWVTVDEITNTNVNLRDRTFASEQLFALNNTRLKDQISGYFYNTTTPLLSRLSVETFGNTSLFSEQADYRYFFEENNGVSNVPSKFWQLDVSAAGRQKSRMPMIRISEMYYIAAECLVNSDLPKAIELIREVQKHRGLTALLALNATVDDVLLALKLEYQREFLGEGQLFFYHKRMGTPVIYNATANYVFPLPDSETDYRK